MVVGLDLFQKHFQAYTEHYVLIGGSACDWHLEKEGLPFRATKDLDIILIVEALSDDFVNHFWEFIKEGEYAIAEVGDKKSFYRFIQPQTEGYPKMIELFSRNPDVIKEYHGMHLTDIPTGEDASSLSAILLDDVFYKFTIDNTIISDGLHVANDCALICLKVRAFLSNKARRDEGHSVQEVDITKHKNDIIKLTAILDPQTRVEVPLIIKTDLLSYIDHLKTESPDISQILKQQGMGNIRLEQIIQQLNNTFLLE